LSKVILETGFIREEHEMAIQTNIEAKYGKDVKFERIRRITGYLVGTMDKWNDAKKAEEHDRVKHGLAH
jgi:ribonucleoside-triphosphate reductase